MKKNLIFAFALAFAPAVFAEGPADDVKAAAKKLAESGSYSWTTTTASASPQGGDGRGFGNSTTDGKTDKSGVATLTSKRGERTTEIVVKAGKAAVKTEEGWKSGEELAARGPGGDGGGGGGGGNRRGGGGFAARMAENFKAPATEAEALATGTKELKKDGDAITGDLTEETLKSRSPFGGRRAGGGDGGGGDRPAPSMKGTVKFWLKDGALAKYEVTTTSSFERDGEKREFTLTTTTEIKDVGTTKLEVPAEATAKLTSGDAPKKDGEKKEEKKEDKSEKKKDEV